MDKINLEPIGWGIACIAFSCVMIFGDTGISKNELKKNKQDNDKEVKIKAIEYALSTKTSLKEALKLLNIKE